MLQERNTVKRKGKKNGGKRGKKMPGKGRKEL